MKMRAIPAEDLSLVQLAELINDTYQDYPLDVWFNAQKIEQMCEYEDVDLERSLVVQVDGKPVGLAFLSIREDVGWISGVGVRPAWRRRGVARYMMTQMQAQARRADLTRLKLEVLTQNTSARSLYRERGFTRVRDLLILLFEPGFHAPNPLPEGILPGHPQALLDHFQAFHDVQPSWQRDYASLKHRVDAAARHHRRDLTGLGYWEDETLYGYLLVQQRGYVFDVLDLAVDPDHPRRREAASRLLDGLHEPAPGIGAHVINLPEKDPVLPAFQTREYRIWQRQHEMVWSVSPNPREEPDDPEANEANEASPESGTSPDPGTNPESGTPPSSPDRT